MIVKKKLINKTFIYIIINIIITIIIKIMMMIKYNNFDKSGKFYFFTKKQPTLLMQNLAPVILF